jgi:hypothetical protein
MKKWNKRLWFEKTPAWILRWDVVWPVQRFFRNIRRGYELTRLTWGNCWCDHSEITDLFMYGLKKLVAHIEEHKNFVGWEYTVSRGKLMIALGERVYSDYYEDEWMGQVDMLYGKSSFDFVPIEGTDTYELKSSREYPYTKEELEAIKVHERELMEAARLKQAKASRIYYALLNHRLNWLWD